MSPSNEPEPIGRWSAIAQDFRLAAKVTLENIVYPITGMLGAAGSVFLFKETMRFENATGEGGVELFAGSFALGMVSLMSFIMAAAQIGDEYRIEKNAAHKVVRENVERPKARPRLLKRILPFLSAAPIILAIAQS